MSTLSYMEKLLDGVEVEWQPLEVVAKIKHGKDWKGLNAGDVPVYGSGGIMGYVDRYLCNKPTVLIPRKGSITNIFYVETPLWNVDTIYYTEIDTLRIVPKYLYYFIKTIDIMSLDTGSGRPSLTQAILNKIQIPIPHLKIQAEIVRILDTFTTLTAELTAKLTAELTDRKKQYNYYRDRLLTFEESEVEWKPLGEIGEFIRGKRFTKADYVDDGIQAIHYGEIYTHYGVSASHTLSQVRAEMAASLRYAIPGDVVMAGVGETVEDVGKAVAWIGSEKVAIHDDSWAFRHSINPTFVSYVMQTTRFINEKTKHISSGKVKRLLINGIEKIRIPIPYPNDTKKSVVEQARVVALLDKFDTLTHSISEGLPREIALRQKQYEYYRDLLLTFPKSEEVKAHLATVEKSHE
jgi:type I restriction enzyme, S subunit